MLTLPLLVNLYKWCDVCTVSVTLSQFRNQQSDYIAAARRDPDGRIPLDELMEELGI